MANVKDDKKPALFEKVAADLIKRLEEGTAPWQKPWDKTGGPPVIPYNEKTGKNYRGLNILALMMENREDPRWMTFKQAADNGWSVNKGERGTLINYYSFEERKALRTPDGKPDLDEHGKQKYATVKLEKPIVTSAFVFNAEQIKGIPPLAVLEIPENNWNAIEAVENVVKNSGAVVKNKKGDEAFYSPVRDFIQLPVKTQFKEPGLYYATLLHELGHWTGHETRLDRPLMNKFGTEDYAKEELRAEIGSYMLGADLKIGHDPSRHASYVANWVEVLKNDPYEIHRAAADAQKIFDMVKGFEQKINIEKDITKESKPEVAVKNKGPFGLNEVINYKDENYKVIELLKKGSLRMENQDTGRVFILKPTDGLHNSLQNAKEANKVNQVSEAPKALKQHHQEINKSFEVAGAELEEADNKPSFKR